MAVNDLSRKPWPGRGNLYHLSVSQVLKTLNEAHPDVAPYKHEP